MNHQEIHLRSPRTTKLSEEIVKPGLRPRHIGTHAGTSQSQIESPFNWENNITPELNGFVDGEIRLRRDLWFIETEERGYADVAVLDDVCEERVELLASGLRGPDTGDPFYALGDAVGNLGNT
jgi:hypothetical protein